MNNIEDNVRQELVKLVPASSLNDISCFMFYDNHPRDTKSIDVIVCTKHCEIIEYYERQIVKSLLLEVSTTPEEIKLIRNKNCALFYLIKTKTELVILSRKECLSVQKIVKNLESYEITDFLCTGRANLKVITKDDAVPLYFDESLANFKDNVVSHPVESVQSIPIITQLKRKLTEATYTVDFNKKGYDDLLKLRHEVGSSIFQELQSNFNDSIFKHQTKQVTNTMVLKSMQPVFKVCNKQIVIALNVTNNGDLPLKNIYLLVHSSQESITYATKLYEQTMTCPFWKEKQSQNLNCKDSATIVAVIELKEFKYNATSRIEFEGVIIYEKDSKTCYVPFEKVKISASETMGENFDILYNLDTKDAQITLLSILATSTKTDLLLRHIKSEKEKTKLNMIQIFCKYLDMEILLDMKNVVMHRKSSFHILYGVMVVFGELNADGPFEVTVYSRSPSQVLALIHFMNDAIPHKIIATTPKYRLLAKTETLEKYTEEATLTEEEHNYAAIAASVIKQSSLILNHLDECMIKMNESKNAKVQSKIGKEIDLFALSKERYSDFRNKLLSEGDKGIKAFLNLNTEINNTPETDIMIIDD